MTKGISLRAAALIIRDGKLLVAKHVDHPCYYVVGGGIEPGETSEAAAIREVREETGFALEARSLVFIQERMYSAPGDGGADSKNRAPRRDSLRNPYFERHHEVVFFYRMQDRPDLRIPEGSLSDQGAKETLHWLPLDQLDQYPLVPGFLKAKASALAEITALEHVVTSE